MPKFIVEEYELSVQEYIVHADEPAEAIERVVRRLGRDQGIQRGQRRFLGFSEFEGMSAERDRELYEACNDMGLCDESLDIIRGIADVRLAMIEECYPVSCLAPDMIS